MKKYYDYELKFTDRDGVVTKPDLSDEELITLSDNIANGSFEGSLEVEETA
ncbi:MAG: hypothetical protein ACTSQF_14315 [Candidatus Heimdallarchaeaceae archaeon]